MATFERRFRASEFRKKRVRARLSASKDRPRLSVFRSGRHMYAQIIDDSMGVTLAAASTRSKELRDKVKKTATREAASEVGKLLAQKAIEKKVTKVCFDRGGYNYHGRVKALADAAREGGLQF